LIFKRLQIIGAGSLAIARIGRENLKNPLMDKVSIDNGLCQTFLVVCLLQVIVVDASVKL
jgi:hypothetical protein